MSHNPKIGLNNHARSPGSIANAQHHDPSGSEKSINGSPATIKSVIATSTTLTPVSNFAVVRVVNTTGSTAFFWSGKMSDDPGVLSAANALALPPNSSEVFHCGASDDDKISMGVKTNVVGVQVVIMEN